MISSQYPGEYHATAMYIYGVSGNTINEVSAMIGLERFRYLNAFVTCYRLNSTSVCRSTNVYLQMYCSHLSSNVLMLEATDADSVAHHTLPLKKKLDKVFQ